MGKCLVTKLNGSCNNDELLKIGEGIVNIASVSNPSKATQGFLFNFTAATEVRIIGDGYFTNESLSDNYGKSKTITNTPVYLSNGDYKLTYNKYKLTKIRSTDDITPSSTLNNKTIPVEYFKYSKKLNFIDSILEGDIANLANSPDITFLGASNSTNFFGDISALQNCHSLSTIYAINTGLSGNVSVFNDKNNIITINLTGTKVSGDISAFANKSKLIRLYLNNTSCNGDISSLKNCSNLQVLYLEQSNITGDVAVLPASTSFLSANYLNLSWTSRPSSSKIIAIENGIFGDYVDKMLQDQANCQVGYTSSSSNAFKKIAVTGTRTSASDAAVQTLQSKGYTVSITPA